LKGEYILSKIITFINEKGGVGKSSVCFNSAWEISSRGKKVLLIDLDGQKANLSFFAGIDKDNIISMAEVFKLNTDISSAIVNVKINLDIIPANSSLASLDMSAKVSKFRNALKQIQDNYDFIFIDVNPAPGWSHYLSLSVTDLALIIMLPDIASLEATKGILDTIDEIQQTNNPKLKILGFLFNKYNSRAILSEQVLQTTKDIASQLNTHVFMHNIRQSVTLCENILAHKGITEYAPKSRPSILYSRFINEFLEVINNG
jgi:chromosome partitioning protein